MKKISIISIVLLTFMSLTISCNEGPTYPSDEELAQKVTDKYGAELDNLKELREMECETTIDDRIEEKLNEKEVTE